MAKIHLLIVEPDIAYRGGYHTAFAGIDDISIDAIVPKARLATERVNRNPPDLVIMDQAIEVAPEQFTSSIIALKPDIGIIIAVPENDSGAAERSVAALGAGAFDFVLKPSLDEPDFAAVLQRRLLPKIRTFSIKRYTRLALTTNKLVAEGTHVSAKQEPLMVPPATTLLTYLKTSQTCAFEAVCIGVSTGGPDALHQLLPLFPKHFPIPIFVVLHMPKFFTLPMAQQLDRSTQLRVRESVPDEIASAGFIYLAQGGVHLELERATQGKIALRSTNGLPENGCKPSVDVLFRSASTVFGARTIGVILTGMGVDGTKGAQLLKEKKAFLIAQDEATSVVWGMPGSAVRSGVIDTVVPLHAIACEILKKVVGEC